jgi:hypothetical protein
MAASHLPSGHCPPVRVDGQAQDVIIMAQEEALQVHATRKVWNGGRWQERRGTLGQHVPQVMSCHVMGVSQG